MCESPNTQAAEQSVRETPLFRPASDNLYERLGARMLDSDKDLKTLYRKAALLYHPDGKKPEYKAYLEKSFKAVNEAWEKLKDPAAREQYDLSLLQNQNVLVKNPLTNQYQNVSLTAVYKEKDIEKLSRLGEFFFYEKTQQGTLRLSDKVHQIIYKKLLSSPNANAAQTRKLFEQWFKVYNQDVRFGDFKKILQASVTEQFLSCLRSSFENQVR